MTARDAFTDIAAILHPLPTPGSVTPADLYEDAVEQIREQQADTAENLRAQWIELEEPPILLALADAAARKKGAAGDVSRLIAYAREFHPEAERHTLSELAAVGGYSAATGAKKAYDQEHIDQVAHAIGAAPANGSAHRLPDLPANATLEQFQLALYRLLRKIDHRASTSQPAPETVFRVDPRSLQHAQDPEARQLLLEVLKRGKPRGVRIELTAYSPTLPTEFLALQPRSAYFADLAEEYAQLFAQVASEDGADAENGPRFRAVVRRGGRAKSGQTVSLDGPAADGEQS